MKNSELSLSNNENTRPVDEDIKATDKEADKIDETIDIFNDDLKPLALDDEDNTEPLELDDDNDLKPLALDNEDNTEPLASDNLIPISKSNNTKIKNVDSNFIFFFGTAESGKSVILSSMLYYLSSEAGILRPKLGTPNTKNAQILLSDFFENIRQGILPSRTTRDQVTRLDLVFEPNNKSKKVPPINLTFLETSGENHNEIRRGGSYHSSIESFLNANIPITFIIITTYETAHKEDTLINEFLDMLEKKGKNLKYINVIVLISKWDKSGEISIDSEEVLDDFFRDRLNRTNQRIDTYGLSKSYYTIGTIEKKNGKEKIVSLNLSTAEILSKWIYKKHHRI